MTRTTLATNLFGLAGLAIVSTLAGACAQTQSGEQRVQIIRNQEVAAEVGGIPPDKQAEVQLVLQQRDSSTLKCYNDVLSEKHDRAFKGSMFVVLTLEPSGKASDVRVVGGSLKSPEVGQCLIEKIKEFDFPQVPNTGSMQYEYRFQPAY